MANISKTELMEVRKQIISQMEQKQHESWSSEEDCLFYYHRSEDKFLLLLRQYQEEMLDAYLQDTEDFPEMLHFAMCCMNIYP